MAVLRKKNTASAKKGGVKLIKAKTATKRVAKSAKTTETAVASKLVNPFANADRPRSRGRWADGGKRPIVKVVETVKDGTRIMVRKGAEARFMSMVSEDTALILPGIAGCSTVGDVMADAIPVPVGALR